MGENHCNHYGSSARLTCDKGHDLLAEYDDATPGIFKRLPCYRPNGIDSCADREWPTAEQIAEEKEAMRRMMEAFVARIPIVEEFRTKYRGTNHTGTAKCACGGALTMRIAAINNHIAGSCDGPCEARWME